MICGATGCCWHLQLVTDLLVEPGQSIYGRDRWHAPVQSLVEQAKRWVLDLLSRQLGKVRGGGLIMPARRWLQQWNAYFITQTTNLSSWDSSV